MRAWASSRACGLVSLLVLASYVLAIEVGARAAGVGFAAFAPWPLGGPDASVSRLAQAAALTLGLSLGWGIPGFALARLSEPRLVGVAFLGRALGLGTGYVLVAGFVHALALGHAPGRPALLCLLALPPLVLVWRRSPAEPQVGRVPPRMLLALVAAIALATGLLWPKLRHEGLNGDGTEAYELARSLDVHPVPHWDLERSGGDGQFGTPVVNPFPTNSYLAHAAMVLLGRGELAARLFFVPALVLAAVVSMGRLAPPTPSAWLYAAGLGAVSALWSSYYVGYEPAFTDLAEPGATHFLTAALWLAGIGEVFAGSSGWGVAFLLLASGVLYSAPVLATTALVALALVPGGRRRPLVLWLAGASAAAATVIGWGWAQGLLPDWYRQLRSEYWHDLVSNERRTPSAPFLGLFLLMTGGLPLAAAVRWRRLSPSSRVLFVTGAVYLAIVLGSSYKALHYLTPLPFIFAAPALEASGARARSLATAALLATLVLSWPDSTRPHRENVTLGEESCLDGIAYEQAALAASPWASTPSCATRWIGTSPAATSGSPPSSVKAGSPWRARMSSSRCATSIAMRAGGSWCRKCRRRGCSRARPKHRPPWTRGVGTGGSCSTSLPGTRCDWATRACSCPWQRPRPWMWRPGRRTRAALWRRSSTAGRPAQCWCPPDAGGRASMVPALPGARAGTCWS
jgi:hypothetical protein